jgi:hypothetical protein
VVIPQVDSEYLTLDTVIYKVPENPHDLGRFGAWLQDSKGRRHEPSLAKAERLLGARNRLQLVFQKPNFFAVSLDAVPPFAWDSQPTYEGAKAYKTRE